MPEHAPVDIEPMPAPAPKVSVLNDLESKYIPKYAKYSEATTNVINGIADRIKNGGTPSKEMLESVLSDISAQTGISVKELERDFDRCFSRNLLGSDWQGIQKAFKTPEVKMLDDIANGGSLSNKINNFKNKRNLQPNATIQTRQGVSGISANSASVKTEQIQTALEKSGLTYDAAKERYIISTDKRQALQDLAEQKLGGDTFAAKKFAENMVQTLKTDDISNIQTMLNACGGEYSAKLLDNPDELLIFYSNLRNSGFFKYGEISDAQWKAVFNLIENPLSSENLGAIMRYKGAGFSAVNEAMTEARINGTPIPEHLQKEIDALQNCIAGQKVSEPFVVYRTEGMEFLNNFNINIDGQSLTLADAMQSCKTDADRMKLMQNISANNYTATQERFTSTSMLKPSNVGTNDANNIVWELEVQPGSQGIYIEGANYTGKLCREREFLLQKNSNIEITGIKLGEDGKWHLQGKISNDTTAPLSRTSSISANEPAATPNPTNPKLEAAKAQIINNPNTIPALKEAFSNVETVAEFNTLQTFIKKRTSENLNHLAKLTTEQDIAAFNDLIKIATKDPAFNPIDSAKFYAKLPPAQKQRYLSMIELVKDGSLDAGVLKSYAGGIFDKRIANDVDLLIKAKKENLTTEQVKDLYIPTITKLTKSDIQALDKGRVFENNGKLMIKISDTQVVPLKISKDTYFELFQPGYNIKQQAAGKCYLYSKIISMMDNPLGQAKLINQCFSEQNGVLTVKMPNSKVSMNVDLNNIDNSIKNNIYYSRGSKGVNLLEQAYENHEVYVKSQSIIDYIQKNINNPSADFDMDKALKILDDLTTNPENPNYVLTKLQFKNGKPEDFTLNDIISLDEARKRSLSMARPQDLDGSGLYYGIEEGNSGYTNQIFGLGKNPLCESATYRTLILKHPQTGQALITDDMFKFMGENNFIINASTGPKPGAQVESVINADLGILSNHNYSCSVVTMPNGKQYIKTINPHNSACPILLTFDQFRNYFDGITINNV